MSTVNSPWKSVSPNICAWGKGFNHFSAVVRCEVVFVVVIIWFSGLECSPYAFVPLSTTYHPHSLWKGIASSRTPGQRPSILSHKPDGDMSIQKAPPLSLQYTFTGHVFNSATRVQSVFTATHLCAYHPGATFQTTCILIKVRISLESILNMFSTHLNWQLTWRWKSFLAQQYAASIAVIVSRAENVEWALDEGCRAYPMMVDIPYMIQVPGTPPVCPPCIVYALYVDRILRPGRLALTCARHIVPLYVCWGVWDGLMGRVHTMPLSRPYTGRAPILSGETKPLWTRPSGHGGHAQMWGAVSFDQSSTPESRGPRYFQGVLDIGSKRRRQEWWFNSSMTVENGDLNINMKTNLECIRDTLGTSNLKLPICGNTDRLIL